MYVLEDPAYELLMLDKHGIITLRKIEVEGFNNIYEIKQVEEGVMIDYEVLCISCEQNLKFYDLESKTLREPTKKEKKSFVLKCKI